jgi:hypothetical protein
MLREIAKRIFAKDINGEVDRRVKLALIEADGFYEGRLEGADKRDRLDYDREGILRQTLEAWRTNPLARRLVQLTSQYVVGGGLVVTCRHAQTAAFLKEWWGHRFNQGDMRAVEWCDELVRSGELFFLLSTDAAGMTYVRAVPAIAIEEVFTSQNDVQQETGYLEKPAGGAALGEGRRWPAYDPLEDARDEEGAFPAVMVHYAINRPARAVRGESDLAPLLRWLARYSSWLEDRVRLNRFRQAFLYVVKARFASEGERLARQAALNTTPPTPGSILVTDESETWEVLKPELDTFEAKEDGLAVKKMVAAGAGVPMHFLAEPEGINRTTAESAGGPTFRHFEQRQQFFTWMVADLARIAVRRRALVDKSVDAHVEIHADGTDLSARDNQALANAAQAAAAAFGGLYERGLIDAGELLRAVYRFAGETADVDDLLARASGNQKNEEDDEGRQNAEGG